ncbi:MAG: putative sulfate exporter family transporter [Ramlibacter sp.]|nr:putative sulfate exporter family transporter [Ramlibacter sp.]
MQRTQALNRYWPGFAVTIVIALAASFVASAWGGPQLLYALLFGLGFHFLAHEPQCVPGVQFCSSTLLRIGVALLGARITLGQVAALGVAPLVLVLCAMVATIGLGWLLSRWLRRPVAEGILSGGAVAICGASAALAISAVLPRTRDNEQYTLLTVLGVTSLSTAAMVIYPLLARLGGLPDEAVGVFLGGAIHDVAQVVGAGYSISNTAGDTATIVKLTRVAFLVPFVLAIALCFGARGASGQLAAPRLPVFLGGFVVLMLLNSAGLIPALMADHLNTLSRICLVMAIAASGVKTSVRALASLGWKPVVMLVAETLWIASLMLVGLWLLQAPGHTA